MTVEVEYWGPARDWAGCARETFEVAPGEHLGALTARMFDKHPALDSRRASLRFAVNQTLTAEDCPLADGDRIAVIPPVSGGQDDDLVEIVREPIDPDVVRRHVMGDPAVGAVATFEGTTRSERHPAHGELVRLEYEAHTELAVSEMRKLAVTVRSRWGARRVAIVHRVGCVPIHEASVVIAVACGHRGDAFEACRYVIDTLKRHVPIWKKEVWADETTTWVEPTGRE